MQRCPVCLDEVNANPRYPRYLCRSCRERVAAADGRRVEFFDTPTFRARYVDTNEPYPGNDCFVDGILCYAREAYFGGIVIETAG